MNTNRGLCIVISFLFGLCTAIPTQAQSPENVRLQEAASFLGAYIQKESISGNEQQAGRFLADKAWQLGLFIEVLTDEPDSYNLAASLYPLSEGKPNVILLNHIDVVPAADPQRWTHPPFSGAISGGYIWGRGAIDNKGMGVMQLFALAAFAERAWQEDFPFNVTLLSVSAEEVGGDKGARLVADHFLELLNPIVVYGEGGSGLTGVSQSKPDQAFFAITVAQKRGLWFALESLDAAPSGHGSVPRSSYPARDVSFATVQLLSIRPRLILTDPVQQMLRLIGQHEKGMRGLALRNIGFFKPFIGGVLRREPLIQSLMTNTLSLTQLYTAEGAMNQIASSATAVFDSRLLPDTDTGDFIHSLEKRIEGLPVSLRIIQEAPLGEVSEMGEFYQAMQTAVESVFDDIIVTPALFPAHNDNVFFRNRGIPAYGATPMLMNPQKVETIHSVDERLSLKNLERGINVYEELIEQLLKLKGS